MQAIEEKRILCFPQASSGYLQEYINMRQQ